jgi:hypothetical protein
MRDASQQFPSILTLKKSTADHGRIWPYLYHDPMVDQTAVGVRIGHYASAAGTAGW